MSSGQDLNKPHKTRIENCKGTLMEPKSNYKKWAYWHGDGISGWHSTPAPNSILPVSSKEK